MQISKTTFRRWAIACLLSSAAIPALSQEVVLDRQVRAGPLTLFPSVHNPTDYYYAPTSARLATNEDGLPTFSFTRYIEPVENEDASEQGDATSIVHAVVELGVSDEDVEEARDVITDLVSGARIMGPVTFTSGTFALVSSFAEEGSETTSTVAGVGTMPLLEGDQGAVSLRLTRRGTLELWENFARATPDVSFSFEAEIDGYRAPKRALIEADFSRIYEHNSFDVGVATPILQAEIEGAFDDLVRDGAIRITQIGEDDAMNSIVDAAYQRLIDIIFEKAETTGVDAVNALSTSTSGTDVSMLEKASNLLAAQRAANATENTAIRERNEERGESAATAARDTQQVSTLTDQRDEATTAATELRQRAAAAREGAEAALADATRFDAEEEDDAAAAARVVAENFTTQADQLDQLAEEKETEAATASTALGTAEAASAVSTVAATSAGPRESEASDSPIAIVASYRMKRVRETGTYRIDLNKYTADTMSLRFDQNIGNLSEWRDDDRIFATVDLADSALRQREVTVFIDGLSKDDFGDYINFATILLRKERDGANPAIDEVRVDRENFSESANEFRLVYNKLTDGSSEDFLDYEYQIDWNFFGGNTVNGTWQPSNESGIGIAPPYQKRTVFLEAAPDLIEEQDIRSIEVEIFYDLAGSEQRKRLSLRPRNGEDMSEQIDFMLPENEYAYDYQISWRLRNGDRPTTGRLTTTDGTLFIDELPEE